MASPVAWIVLLQQSLGVVVVDFAAAVVAFGVRGCAVGLEYINLRVNIDNVAVTARGGQSHASAFPRLLLRFELKQLVAAGDLFARFEQERFNETV